MIFNSAEFLLFYPLVLLLYFVLPKNWKWVMLLAASYYFYMFWNPPLIFLILFTTAVSYFSGIIIEKTNSKGKKKLWLALTLITSLGVLFFFKYYNFLAASAVSVWKIFGGAAGDPTLALILPVGISFYTFQTLSYVIDVYRERVKAEHHFGYYALFVSFFPQLVAGPIERPENLLPQLKEAHKFEASNAYAGLQKMAVGFFKKIAVADILAVFVDKVYNSPESATGFGVLLSTVLFAVQIYCDFSGYTDIAIGCARIMGIRLMQNFNRPYKARSIKEFWSRWHISLSEWFRDYLYIPLGGNRCSKPRYYFNLFVVFLVSGLWHGANWTFVIWGVLHGVFQIVGAITRPFRTRLYDKLRIQRESTIFMLGQRFVTFLLVCFAWIFFRANSMGDLGILLNRLFTSWGSGSLLQTVESMGITLTAALIVILAVLCMWMMDVIADRAEKAEGNALSFQYTASVVALAVAAAWLLLLSAGRASAFIYFQF